MDTHNYHSLSNLFDQLGLPSDATSINNFIEIHRPLAHNVELAQAPWWTASQAAFLRESIADDADWAIMVDELDTLLRTI